MGENSILKAKEMLKEFAENCKKYRNFEKEVAAAKKELENSQNKIKALKTEIDELVKEVPDLNPVDLETLNQEISILLEEKSKLGFFAIRRFGQINSALRQKKNELSDGTYKNELIAEIEEKKKAFSFLSESEEKKQQESKNIIEIKGERLSQIVKLINNCEKAFLNIPDEALFYLVEEIGAVAVNLPISVLKRIVSVGVPDFIKNMSVQDQVKLLYPYDTPIYFGGKEWNVLEIKKNEALLLHKGPYTCSKYYRAKYAWEEKTRAANAFHRGEKKWLKWENSEARKILNEDFIKSLTLKENEKILSGHNGDKVFCLSVSEVERYLAMSQRTIEGAWWLRDTKYYAGNKEYGLEPDSTSEVAYIDMFGRVEYNYNNWEITQGSSTKSMCFRPALWVELPYDSLDTEWNKTGHVICKGKWTVENCYSNITVDLDAVARRMNETLSGPTKEELPDFIVVPRIDVSDM